VASEICLEIFRSVASGESEHASSLQAKLTPLAQAVTTRFGIGGLKAALDMKGYVGGFVRTPLAQPSDEAREEIRLCLNATQPAEQAKA